MITPLAEALDGERFGGKAVQLGTAIRGGLPVPSGYALSADVVEAVADGASSARPRGAWGWHHRGLLAGGDRAVVEDAAGAFVRVSPAATPGPAARRYAEAHAAYRELYPALAPTFHRRPA